MNRRDFLTKGAISAAAVAVPVTKAEISNTFPETMEEMQALVAECQRDNKYVIRGEYQLIPEGMSMTGTGISAFWHYHKGNRIATLHVRYSDKHICFYSEKMDEPQPRTYTPPKPQQWAKNRNRDWYDVS